MESALRRLRAVRALGAKPSRRAHLSHRAAEVLAPPRRFSALRAQAAAAADAIRRRCRRAAAAVTGGGPAGGSGGSGGSGAGGGSEEGGGTWELGYPLGDGAAAATLEVVTVELGERRAAKAVAAERRRRATGLAEGQGAAEGL